MSPRENRKLAGSKDVKTGYNPMNKGYVPDGQRGYSPKGDSGSKTPSPPKGGTAVSTPNGSKK